MYKYIYIYIYLLCIILCILYFRLILKCRKTHNTFGNNDNICRVCTKVCAPILLLNFTYVYNILYCHLIIMLYRYTLYYNGFLYLLYAIGRYVIIVCGRANITCIYLLPTYLLKITLLSIIYTWI